MLDPGERKIEAIKEVRWITNYGLKEAKELVDSCPNRIASVEYTKAIEIMNKLTAIGAKTELQFRSKE